MIISIDLTAHYVCSMPLAYKELNENFQCSSAIHSMSKKHNNKARSAIRLALNSKPKDDGKERQFRTITLKSLSNYTTGQPILKETFLR